MRALRQLLERGFERAGEAAQALQALLIGREFGSIRQLFVDQQIRDLLELGRIRKIEDVVAAIVQVVAGAADGTKSSVAGGDAGEGDGFLWFRGARGQKAHRASFRSRGNR